MIRLKSTPEAHEKHSRPPFHFTFVAILTASLLVLALNVDVDNGEGIASRVLIYLRGTSVSLPPMPPEIPPESIWPSVGGSRRVTLAKHPRCVGPSNVTFASTLRGFEIPSAHSGPVLGDSTLSNLDMCTSYDSRFGPYTDEALGSKFYVGARNELGNFLNISVLNRRARPQAVPDWRRALSTCHEDFRQSRDAFVLPLSSDREWTVDDLLNARAMIAEVGLDATRPTSFHILLLARTGSLAFEASDQQRRRLLAHSLPLEFWDLTTIWHEDEMASYYKGLKPKLLKNHMTPYDAYRAAFMPLQKMAVQQGQSWDHIWNWDFDTRTTFDLRLVLDAIEQRAESGHYDKPLSNFSDWTDSVEAEHSEAAQTFANANLSSGSRPIDLLSIDPIFDIEASGWYWGDDVQNYPVGMRTQARASYGNTMRISRRLLTAMHTANAEDKRSTESRAWPATICFHSALDRASWSLLYPSMAASYPSEPYRVVYVPHPIFAAHQWQPGDLAKKLNTHDFSATTRRALRSLSFYDDGSFGARLYAGWLANSSTTCRTPSLIHPVRGHLLERFRSN